MRITRLLLIAALVAFGAVIYSSAANADPDPTCTTTGKKEFGTSHCAVTHATNGSGGAPTVTNTWELPDMVVEAKSAGAFSPMQYIDPATKTLPEASHRHDDGVNGKTARIMQMLPQPANNPNQRQVEVWALVQSPINSPTDIQTVSSSVNYPDSACASPPCQKIAPFKLTKRACIDMGDPASAAATYQQTPLHAATHTGQIAEDKGLTGDAASINAAAHQKYKDCINGVLTVWSGIFKLDKNQDPGIYEVSTIATSAVGGLSPAHLEEFEVLQLLSFRMDFNNVNWGPIAAGAHVYVPGNDTIDQPFPSLTPTVENVGNVDVCLNLTFSAMVGKIGNPPSQITIFDAALNDGTEYAFEAGVAGRFPVPLVVNDPSKLTFSLTAPTPLIAGDYNGRLDLSIKKTTPITTVTPEACPPKTTGS